MLTPTSYSFSVNKKGPALRSETTKGFTLIELLTTISVIAILATIAILNYQNISEVAGMLKGKLI
mgnify:CR=1 FL=1